MLSAWHKRRKRSVPELQVHASKPSALLVQRDKSNQAAFACNFDTWVLLCRSVFAVLSRMDQPCHRDAK